MVCASRSEFSSTEPCSARVQERGEIAFSKIRTLRATFLNSQTLINLSIDDLSVCIRGPGYDEITRLLTRLLSQDSRLVIESVFSLLIFDFLPGSDTHAIFLVCRIATLHGAIFDTNDFLSSMPEFHAIFMSVPSRQGPHASACEKVRAFFFRIAISWDV